MVARVANLTHLFLSSLQMVFCSHLKSTKCLFLEKNISVMKYHRKADTVVTAFGVVLCCQGHKLFSNYFIRGKKKYVCVSEDAGNIIFVCSFIQVDDLSKGCGLACTDPGIASLVSPQKPSKPATEQEGKYCNPCFTHGEWKQRNPEQLMHSYRADLSQLRIALGPLES